MDISITEQVVRVKIVSLKGRLDSYHAMTLRQHFDELYRQGAVFFVIDLAEVDFMDSIGMSALVSLHKRVRQVRGIVKFVWPKEEAARQILQLARFDRVFDLAESLDETLAGVANGTPRPAE